MPFHLFIPILVQKSGSWWDLILSHTFMEQSLKFSDLPPTNYEPNPNFRNKCFTIFHTLMDPNSKKSDLFPTICEHDPNFSSSPVLLRSKTQKDLTSSLQIMNLTLISETKTLSSLILLRTQTRKNRTFFWQFVNLTLISWPFTKNVGIFCICCSINSATFQIWIQSLKLLYEWSFMSPCPL